MDIQDERLVLVGRGQKGRDMVTLREERGNTDQARLLRTRREELQRTCGGVSPGGDATLPL